MPETTQFGDGEGSVQEGTLTANTILMNRYKILGVVGGGGQGAVYNSRDLNFPDAKRLVAVKEMRYPTGDPKVRSVASKTFQREANMLATLSHPAIPKIFDFFDQNNRAYLVMEFVNGSDLELLLNKTKELPLEKIIEWAIDLCDVLHYLHTHQPEPIVFRDIKPANIMIDSLGKVRLIDFGIAKTFVSGVKNTMIGTEGYSAPEQYKGDVTPQSDIYGLGATLHHIITRKDPRLEAPFSFNERPIHDYAPNAPTALQQILDKALAMDAGERYQTAEEMKEALIELRFRPVSVTNQGTNTAESANSQNQRVQHASSASSSYPEPQEETGTGFFTDPEFETDGNVQPRWIFKTEDEIRGSPIAYRSKALVGSYDHNLWAFNVEDGSYLWKYASNEGVPTTPAVDPASGLVFFGSEDSSLYALNVETGKLIWSYLSNGRIRSSPTVAHDHVFFGSDDGRLYALVAASGRYLWEYDMGAEVRTRPWVTRDLVIVGAESGEVAGIELSGNRKWSVDVSKRGRAVSSSPFVDETEGIAYVGCFDGYMYAIDITNGYIMWRFRTNKPIISSAALSGTTLVFGSVDGNLYALNSETAKERWRYTIGTPIVASPVIHNGKVYIGGTDGMFYCVDAKTGKDQWQFQTDAGITSTPYIADDVILVSSMDHTLYALPLVN